MYSFFGTRAHLVHRSDTGLGRAWSSACGRYPAMTASYLYLGGDMGWLGVGGQDEYDKAERLPLCKDCERISSVKKETVEEKNSRLLADRNASLLRRRLGS